MLRLRLRRRLMRAAFSSISYYFTFMKPQKDKDSQKNANIAGDSADGLAIVLSLGVLFGIVGNNI